MIKLPILNEIHYDLWITDLILWKPIYDQKTVSLFFQLLNSFLASSLAN